MGAPGPPVLGRGVVISTGDAPPDPWAATDVVRVDDAVLADPAAAVVRLHDAWASRRPVVVELAVDAVTFREPVGHDVAPWRAGAEFEPWWDRLHFLVWANNYDARHGAPVWWWGRKAGRLGADDGGPADVVLPDGRAAWIDGGPRSSSLGQLGVGADVVVHTESVDAGALTPVPDAVAPTAALAADQLSAVAHDAGPARIVAPAGSGKTRVLTERLRHLLRDRHYEPSIVVAVAYNRQAQQEMASRTADVGARIQTLNAWGYSLLTRHLGRRPQVLDERDVRRIVEGLVPRQVRRVNTDPFARYIEGLSLVRLGLRDPTAVEDELGDVPGLAAAFDPYRDELRRRAAIDFDEQIYATVEALLRDGELRRAAQDEHRHLLVDELQDLTPAHMLLVRLLSCPTYDTFGVGDDDQTINRHIGADPAFLVEFDRFFPGAATHALEVNYRCPAAVTRGAATLLTYNYYRVAKTIRPGPDVSGDADGLVVHTHPTQGGADAAVDAVRTWLAAGHPTADIAVLARVQSLLLAPHVALHAAAIPIDSILDTSVLQRLGVRAALAYLRIATDPTALEPSDLIEVQRRPSRGLPQWADKWLGRCRSIDDVRRAGERIDDSKVAGKLEGLASDLDLLAAAAAGGATTRRLLTAVRDDVGLGSAMTLLDSTGVAAASHLDDLEGLLQVSDLHPDPAGFAAWLHAAFSQERADGGVTLSTVHRVKGREWPAVLVFGATEELMPHRLSDDVEEERRVFHVAITRSSTQTIVLGDAARPSPFIAELAGTAPRAAPGADPAATRRRAAAAPVRSAAPPSVDAAGPVAVALKRWRTERAKADAVPAYVVLSDKHLLAVAERCPATSAELLACPGIGPTRLDTYGEDILAVIRSAVA